MEKNYLIEVDVTAEFLPDHSEPDQEHFMFAYHITIQNTGNIAATLLGRHWLIVDAENRVQEVRGEGVVGERPYLKPGEQFRYTSSAVIPTPVGSMRGSYKMLADDGIKFDATIKPFTLAVPNTLH